MVGNNGCGLLLTAHDRRRGPLLWPVVADTEEGPMVFNVFVVSGW